MMYSSESGGVSYESELRIEMRSNKSEAKDGDMQ